MFGVCITGDTAHIDTIFKFLPHTRQHGCFPLAQTPSFSKLFISRTNGLVCWRALCILCTKCTLHSNHRLNSCDIPTHKTTSPRERPFSHYIHSHRLAAEMWTVMKNNLPKKNLSCSFYLYRFRKYVSYGFPITNFCNPGVHYETPCMCSKCSTSLEGLTISSQTERRISKVELRNLEV